MKKERTETVRLKKKRWRNVSSSGHSFLLCGPLNWGSWSTDEWTLFLPFPFCQEFWNLTTRERERKEGRERDYHHTRTHKEFQMPRATRTLSLTLSSILPPPPSHTTLSSSSCLVGEGWRSREGTREKKKGKVKKNREKTGNEERERLERRSSRSYFLPKREREKKKKRKREGLHERVKRFRM